jgi:cell division protein FtsW
MHKTVDKPFLFFTGLLVVFGVLIFSSASLGLLARENASMSGQVINQVIALAIGIIAAAVAVRMPPRAWHRYAFYFFLAAIGVTLLVFVPGIGHAHGGAARWLAIGPFSVQPGEVLKFAFVLYYAAWCSALQKRKRKEAESHAPRRSGP